MNATLYYLLGGSLAVLAVLTTFVGLRVPRFPGSTAIMAAMIAIFIALVGATTTFAVLNGQDEQQERAQELSAANEEVEAAEGQPGATGGGGAAEPEEAAAEPEEAAAGQEEGGGEEAAGGAQEAAGGPGGTLQLAAEPTEIAFDTTKLSSKPGKVTIDFTNPSALEHNVAIEKDGKELAESETISEGKTSVSVDLAPGTYTFLCTIPGHAEAGMEGTLTVR
jgi:plastocyanin